MVLRIPFEVLTSSNHQYLISAFINESQIQNIYFENYLKVGTHYGNKIGRGIPKDKKEFSPDMFPQLFRSSLVEWLNENAGLKITSIRQTLVDFVIKEVSKGFEEGLDVRTIARNIEKIVRSRNFYRWQALRIARTETTAAANYGATVAMEQSGLVMEKLWISSNNSRTRQIEKGDRYDHIDMEGVRVGKNDFFNVQGDLIRFPGDPKGQAANVINCRCTVALVPKRDENGRLIFS
jgi:uncharacterized protein with gpF-like domain